jgi:Spy/CpxP family protein refolding chaperone
MTMKTNLKISLVAGLLMVAGLAYSQAPMGGDCGMMGGHEGGAMNHQRMGRMDPAKMQAMMDKRHAVLKAKLKITPAQESAWVAFEAAHKLPAGMKEKRESLMADMAKLTTPERLDKMKELRTAHMGEMTAAMDKRAQATKDLYAVLTPEQQKVFDALPMRGHGAPGAVHGKRPVNQPKP